MPRGERNAASLLSFARERKTAEPQRRLIILYCVKLEGGLTTPYSVPLPRRPAAQRVE